MTLKLIGCVLIALFFITGFLKKDGSLSFIVSFSAFLLVILTVVGESEPIFGFLEEQTSKDDTSYISVLIKALGTGFVCSFSSSLCRECGKESLSSSIELFGKVEIIVSALPLLTELMELCGA